MPLNIAWDSLGYSAVLIVGGCGAVGLYQNRWSIANSTLDRFLELKRALVKPTESQCFGDRSQYIVTEIKLRVYASADCNKPVYTERHVIDAHLGSSTIVDLEKLDVLPLKGVELESNPTVLVDIYYHFHRHKYLVTRQLTPFDTTVTLAHDDKMPESVNLVAISDIEYYRDDEVSELDEVSQECLRDQITRYLGPKGDFHNDGGPVMSHWLDLKGLQLAEGDKLVLNTDLMEQCTIEYRQPVTAEFT